MRIWTRALCVALYLTLSCICLRPACEGQHFTHGVYVFDSANSPEAEFVLYVRLDLGHRHEPPSSTRSKRFPAPTQSALAPRLALCKSLQTVDIKVVESTGRGALAALIDARRLVIACLKSRAELAQAACPWAKVAVTGGAEEELWRRTTISRMR